MVVVLQHSNHPILWPYFVSIWKYLFVTFLPFNHSSLWLNNWCCFRELAPSYFQSLFFYVPFVTFRKFICRACLPPSRRIKVLSEADEGGFGIRPAFIKKRFGDWQRDYQLCNSESWSVGAHNGQFWTDFAKQWFRKRGNTSRTMEESIYLHFRFHTGSVDLEATFRFYISVFKIKSCGVFKSVLNLKFSTLIYKQFQSTQ